MRLLRFYKQIITIMVLVVTAQLWCIGSADAQGYIVTERAVPAAGGGKVYVITPTEPRKTYTPPRSTYVPRATTTSTGLTSTLTPHWVMYWQHSGYPKGYAGFYQAKKHCEDTRKIITPVMQGRLWCEYVR